MAEGDREEGLHAQPELVGDVWIHTWELLGIKAFMLVLVGVNSVKKTFFKSDTLLGVD